MQTFNYDAVKDLIRCPKTRAPLVYTGNALVCCDPEARLRYPIVDGFPILLVDEATALSREEWATIMSEGGHDPVTGEKSETPASKA
ncbi:MAG: hypothetical protein M3552_08660 [Planctomycetota bacterium]|nr:hypothetical protein [Planctomycetaceae bacterium]MDQ3330712.1 hypothetical protein [Planctomycetota bacterium]